MREVLHRVAARAPHAEHFQPEFPRIHARNDFILVCHLLFHRAKQFADLAFDAAEAAATGPPADLERAEFDQSNGGREFRLVQRRLQSAD